MQKITPSDRTKILVSLVESGKLPARARSYSDDIIKSHIRGLIKDSNIAFEIQKMGLAQ